MQCWNAPRLHFTCKKYMPMLQHIIHIDKGCAHRQQHNRCYDRRHVLFGDPDLISQLPLSHHLLLEQGALNIHLFPESASRTSSIVQAGPNHWYTRHTPLMNPFAGELVMHALQKHNLRCMLWHDACFPAMHACVPDVDKLSAYLHRT